MSVMMTAPEIVKSAIEEGMTDILKGYIANLPLESQAGVIAALKQDAPDAYAVFTAPVELPEEVPIEGPIQEEVIELMAEQLQEMVGQVQEQIEEPELVEEVEGKPSKKKPAVKAQPKAKAPKTKRKK